MPTDVEGNVVAIQGRAIDTGAPSDGHVLTWDGPNEMWTPKVPAPLSNPFTALTEGTVDLTDGTTNTISNEVYAHTILKMTGTLSDTSGDTVVVFPVQIGFWVIDLSGLTPSTAAATLLFQSGSSSPVGLDVGTSATYSKLVFVLTSASNTLVLSSHS